MVYLQIIYVYEKYNVNRQEEDISLVKFTSNLIEDEYSDKIKKILN